MMNSKLTRHDFRGGLPLRSGYYYSPIPVTFTTRLMTEADLQAAPIIVPRAVVADSLNVEVTTEGSAGAVVRLGIYGDDNGLPGALLVDGGTSDATTTGVKTQSISQTLPAGVYWLVAVAQGAPATTPTLRSIFGNAYIPQPVGATYLRASFSNYGVTGALPATYDTTPDLDAGDFPFVQLGIA